MLTIYHAPGTRSVRPIWLCFELGIEVDVRVIPFTPEYLSSPEWRAISPAGKLPVLQDGDLTMFESGAMMDYLLMRYGHGDLSTSTDPTEFALHQQWSWFAESTLAKPLGISRMLREDESESVVDVATQKIEECLSVVENALDGQAFILGERFTSADIMLGYSLVLMQRFKMLDERYPRATDYIQRLLARDGCQRVLSL